MNAHEIYERYIKPLPPAERLQLLVLLAQELAQHPSDFTEQSKHSIMELHGLGAEIWGGVDAQEYVDELRKEWDDRP